MDAKERDISYAVFDTAWGTAGLAWTGRGVCGLVLPGLKPDEIVRDLRSHHPEAVPAATDGAARAVAALQAYFEGRPSELKLPIDLFFATPFQREVYGELMKIPRGQTRSYGQIAGALGKPRAARAVGGANAKNRIPLIIPCHRVIAADGGPGGFSAPGGVKTKQKLLELEGVSHLREKSS